MRRVCCICKILYGLKEPLEDDSETTGFCPECFELEILKISLHREPGIDPWKNEDPTF